jgi:HD superfamily phosphohydrolase
MRKRIRDPIHGYVELDDEILKIVDNEFFQRLRYIKQNEVDLLCGLLQYYTKIYK